MRVTALLLTLCQGLPWAAACTRLDSQQAAANVPTLACPIPQDFNLAKEVITDVCGLLGER
jgi:hypothetical protein